MKALFLIFLLVAVDALAMGSRRKPSQKDDLTDYIARRRIEEIKRQAPLCGIPVEKALSVKASIKLCPEGGRNKDGSYVCGPNACAGYEDKVCAHAHFQGAHGARHVRYMFAAPDVKDGTIAHEVHHELMVVWYGIGGHPRRSRVTRLDNGEPLTINHAAVIGFRWPQLVNWALPERFELGPPWGWSETFTPSE